MKLTIVGCAGSYPSPASPASCYLLEHDGFVLLLDLGNGALGSLQQYIDPRTINAIALSHLHPDHCLDMPSLHVLAKYHPAGPYDITDVWGPVETESYLS
jgi:ribonuclease BN (tRNA processing enzyme)